MTGLQQGALAAAVLCAADAASAALVGEPLPSLGALGVALATSVGPGLLAGVVATALERAWRADGPAAARVRAFFGDSAGSRQNRSHASPCRPCCSRAST